MQDFFTITFNKAYYHFNIFTLHKIFYRFIISYTTIHCTYVIDAPATISTQGYCKYYASHTIMHCNISNVCLPDRMQRRDGLRTSHTTWTILDVTRVQTVHRTRDYSDTLKLQITAPLEMVTSYVAQHFLPSSGVKSG